MQLSSYSGGDLRNAIPREAFATVVVPSIKKEQFEKFVAGYQTIYHNEFKETDPDIKIFATECPLPEKVVNAGDQYRIIRALFVCPNGVQRMSASMPGLVETSNNLAIVRIKDGKFEAHCLTRSSVDTAKEATAWKIAAVFHLIDAKVELSGSYPGWNPNMASPILKAMQESYKGMFGNAPKIMAIHAGLECGIIMGGYPHLDSISFGPTIRHPHSPDEKVDISTVEKFYKFLVETLANAPVK